MNVHDRAAPRRNPASFADVPGSLGLRPAGTRARTAPAPRPTEPLHCNTFTEFVERVALPRLLENPRALRFDGQDSGGNRKVAGRFVFAGKQWRVPSDTHFEPLLLAWQLGRRHSEARALEHLRSVR